MHAEVIIMKILVILTRLDIDAQKFSFNDRKIRMRVSRLLHIGAD
jgi:hypothetical protein